MADASIDRYMVKAKEINGYLRKNNIKIVRKSDLRSIWGISSLNAPAIYASLVHLGWELSWNELTLPKQEKE